MRRSINISPIWTIENCQTDLRPQQQRHIKIISSHPSSYHPIISNHPIQAHRTGRFPAPLEVLRHEVVDLQGASDAAHRQRGAQGVGGHQMGRRAAHLALHVLLVPCVHQVAIELQPKFFGTCWRGKPGWFWGKPNWRCSDLFHGDSGWFPWGKHQEVDENLWKNSDSLHVMSHSKASKKKKWSRQK